MQNNFQISKYNENSIFYNFVSYIAIATFIFIAIYLWADQSFLKITDGIIGEAFEAYHGALNVIRFGWSWGGLQDMSTNPESAAHPFFYIHHPNFGLYFSYILHMFGIDKIENQNLLSGIGTLLGLIFGWYLCLLLSKSKTIAATYIIILAIEVQLANKWAFNIHRAFEYVSIFMPTSITYLWLQNNTRQTYLIPIIFIGIALALGQDYMAYFTLLIILMALPFSINELKSRLIYYRYYTIILGSFISLFLIRQIQVIVGAGVDIWKRDFLYQILNRLHLERLYTGDWSTTTTEFYTNESIINPGFAPYVGLMFRFKCFITSIGDLILSSISIVKVPNSLISTSVGLSFFILSTGISISCIMKSIYKWKNISIKISNIMSMLGVIGFGLILGYGFYTNWSNLISLRLILILLTIATVITVICLFLMPAGQYLFFKLKSYSNNLEQSRFSGLEIFSLILTLSTTAMYFIFPTYFMLVFPSFLIAPCFISIWAIAILSPTINCWKNHKMGVISLISLILIKIIIITPLMINKPMPSNHVHELRNIQGKIVVSNFTPASISSITHNFSGWLSNEGITKLISTGYIKSSDYFMLLERDKQHNDIYSMPQYIFYYKAFGSDSIAAFLADSKAILISESMSYSLYKIGLDNKSV